VEETTNEALSKNHRR